MFLIPAIDLRGGKCVRLHQGDYAQEKVYGADPAAVAEEFEAAGAEWLHVVDLDAAKSGTLTNGAALAEIIRRTKLRVEFGGGVRDAATVRRLLDLGVARAVLGSVLARDPESCAALFAEFGEGLVAGIDTRNGFAAAAGWTETHNVSGEDLARQAVAMGARRVIFTDIATDGAMTGPNLPALSAMIQAVPVPVVASGGIANLTDLVAVAGTGAEAVIVGRAIYEGAFTVQEALRTVQPSPAGDSSLER